MDAIPMDSSAIYQRLTPLFCETFDNDDIVLRPEMTAEDVDGWDSFSHIRLVVAVETEFNVSLTASEVAALKNVGEFVSLLTRKRS